LGILQSLFGPSASSAPLGERAVTIFPPRLDCWYLTGPSAAGKSAVALALAERLGAEILSLDSIAVYRRLEIGAAKPPPEARRRVPHHLLDLVDPSQEFSIAEYLAAAHAAVDAVQARGRTPLFVGGSPLYLKALLRGLFTGPAADWELRRRLSEVAQREGPAALHARLAAVDPASAARLHPNDSRRLIRAIEVFEQTGRPLSQWQRQFHRATAADACRVFVLDWPRASLYRRIDLRVEAMFAAGLVEEVRGLMAGTTPLSRTAAQAVGYREVIEHLRGERGLAETIERVKTHTRQLAKRQSAWFRSLSECRFVPAAEPLDPKALAERIASLGG
jgi:tRNA dimethylallyltransferase